MQPSLKYTPGNLHELKHPCFSAFVKLGEKAGSFQTAKMLATLLLCVAFFTNANGQTTSDGGIEDLYHGGQLTGSSLQINTPNQQDFVPGYESAYKIKNIVRLKINEEYSAKIIPSDFTVSAVVKIDYGHNQLPENTTQQTLTVSYKRGEGLKYNAKSYFSFEGAEHVKITLLQDLTPATVGTISIGDLLILENEMRVTRYYVLNPAAQITLNTPTSSPTDEFEITWICPDNAGNTHTQLEWTWLEKELESEYHVGGVLNTNLLFQNNATRVDLKRGVSTYKIPMLYGGQGKLYYRIRPVNLKNGIRTDGLWSDVKSEVFTGHNNNLNWQSTITYAEDGKRKAVIQYYDGSLRSRQTVTKDNVTGNVVTAETFYDGQGRPAVQVLPTPAPAEINTISYLPGLNLFKESTILNLPKQTPDKDPADYFDLRPKATITDKTPELSTANGASRYYSPSNPDLTNPNVPAFKKNIPDAEGYPYTVTRYTPDASGRIMAQSGVGKDFSMGSGQETKYYYGTAAQEELDGLFGTEVGYASHYFKNMVKDANGQMSVSYVDMHGRTIATALAGDPPSTLTSLDRSQYSNQNKNPIKRDLLLQNANVIKNNSIESVNTLLVPYNSLYKFTYKLTPDKLSLQACDNTPLCYDCLYDLEISITEESGDELPTVYKFTNVGLNSDNCSTEIPTVMNAPGYENQVATINGNEIKIEKPLTIGSYIVRKTLTLSEASLEKYRQQYLDPQGAKGICETEEQIAASLLTTMKNVTKCDQPPANACVECNAAIVDETTFRTNYLLAVPDATETQITEAYKTARASCDKLCNNSSQELATKRALMIMDMMPYSGQYSRGAEERVLPGTMYDTYNIDPSTNPAGQDPAQAEALLSEHPEYDRLVFADGLSSSYNWMHNFLKTPDFATASEQGYLFTSSANLSDPFYTEATSKKAAMAAKFTGSYQGGTSMWQLAYAMVMCQTLINPLEWETCSKQIDGPEDLSNLTTDQRNGVWVAFRNLYAAERNKDLAKYITEQVPLDDADDLVDQKYILRFPEDGAQIAEQIGNLQGVESDWGWMPESNGGTPNLDAIPGSGSPEQIYQGNCSAYIEQWKQSLLQCSTLQGLDPIVREGILNEITAAMVIVCEKGANAMNPYGASTVPPSTPQDGSPRSFEEVILKVFQDKNIGLNEFCNPYVIEYPRPYGTGRRMTAEKIVVVESCQCDQLNEIKEEAAAAGKNPDNLASLNEYLQAKYKETISEALFLAMQENCSKMGATSCKDVVKRMSFASFQDPPCDCELVLQHGITNSYDCKTRVCTPISSFVLSSPQPFPLFLKCGFEQSTACIDCARLSDFTAQFKQRFPSYNAPFIQSGDLTEDQIRYNVLYQRFLNFHTGFEYTWMDYLKRAAETGCDLANYEANESAHQEVICGDSKPLNDGTDLIKYDDDCQLAENLAAAWAHQIYIARIQKQQSDFENAYRAKCLAVQDLEKFTVEYDNKEYHYTLYYYDLAGNLVKTVPPKGVRPDFSEPYTDEVKEARISNTDKLRPHVLVTDYRYNSLNQVVAQRTPDAGISRFWYDRLGRLAVSQNAHQADPAKSPEGGGTLRYSYTRYDALGRIEEVGQKPQATAMTQLISQDDDDLKDWITVEGGTREQVTQTGYDIAFIITPSFPDGILAGLILKQENLRNRVAYTVTKKTVLQDELDYDAGTFYSYDVHGNVDVLVQDYKAIAKTYGDDYLFKKMEYDYDLISGKVNMVSYQKDKDDAFYHKYEYDAENRLTTVRTSRDKIEWQRDALYQYYKHGPLARTVLGDQQVQGIDYVYTLQGWLKGVNPGASYAGDGTCPTGSAVDELEVSSRATGNTPLQYLARNSITFTPDFESSEGDYFETDLNDNLVACTPSASGPLTPWEEPHPVARDAFNFSLNYHQNDYRPIVVGAAPDFANVWQGLGSNAAPLFNGNIADMAVSIPKLGDALVYNYRYDQLNRLVGMDAYSGLQNNANPISLNLMPDYKERISYDPNGNILTYLRNGAPAKGKPEAMDNLAYQYKPATNQLAYVQEDVTIPNAAYSEDIDGQSSGNYEYDAIGNLIKDANNQITWNVYGTIATITKHDGITIQYSYDASGNRISKRVFGNGSDKRTVYVRDASGNTMSVFELNTSTLRQLETHLYGSNRLGILNELTQAPQKNVSMAAGYAAATLSTFTRGERAFELSNHLGNVLVVVSDKKTQHDSGNGTTDYYVTDVLSATDYAPFGMHLAGRKWNSSNYRYGFNSKENDNEVNGDGNQQDYGMRIYDPRLGKFLSVDPLTKEFPWNSSYAFAENDVIRNIDLDGAEKMGRINSLSYDGTGWDYVRAIENGIRDGVNLIPDTWNSGVDFYRSFKTGTTLSGLKKDVKTIGSDLKNFGSYYSQHPKQFLRDAIKPENVQGYFTTMLFTIPGTPTGSTKNILRAPSSKGIDIALGKNINLERFASQTSSISMHAFDKIPGYSVLKNSFYNFEEAFQYVTQAAINTKGKILFNLEFVDLKVVGSIKPGTGLYQKLPELANKSLWELGKTTEWEMVQVLNSKELLKITEFRRMGVTVPESSIKNLVKPKNK